MTPLQMLLLDDTDSDSDLELLCMMMGPRKIPRRLRAEFGVSYGFLSETTKSIERWLFKHATNKLSTFNPVLCTRERLTKYARAIAKYGCPVPNVCAVIDGTKFAIAKPGGEVANDIATHSGKHPSQNCLRSSHQTVSFCTYSGHSKVSCVCGSYEKLKNIYNDSVVSLQ